MILKAHAQKKAAKHILYSGMSYIMSEFRGRGSAQMFLATGEQWAIENNCVMCLIGTYPSFNAQVHHSNPGKFSSIAYIPFHTLNFNPYSSTKKSVFKGIESGMNLIATV